MISTNDLRRGMYVELDGILYNVVESQHIKPGKGGAFVRCKLRNVKNSSIFDRTFNAGEKVQLAEIDENRMQYMYRTDDRFFFLDQNTYEEVSLSASEVGENIKFLKEAIVVKAFLYKGTIFGIELPIVVDLFVKETGPGIRGDTVSSGSKPAILETGASIQVPLFINNSDTIKVDTRTGKYIERTSAERAGGQK